MRVKLTALTIAMLLFAGWIAPHPVVLAGTSNPMLKVGLAYASNAMPAANLANEDGAGYQFGYYDADRVFVPLGFTYEEKITMLKNKTMYLSDSGRYSDVQTSPRKTIGAYSLDIGQGYYAFADAQNAASQINGGYPAWINGAFRVLTGHYETQSGASAAAAAGWSVVAPNASAVLIVRTSDAAPLFFFDGGADMALGVSPSVDGTPRPLTWFSDNKYAGGFEYRRVNGNDMTVINVVDVQNYAKGVIPYEMSPTWPIEALKAQALCAKSYALHQKSVGKHKNSGGFDLCNTIDCQVYRGARSESALSNQAVDDTYGIYVTYQGQPIEAVYHASNGGYTENSENVWEKVIPYLRAVADNFENLETANYGTWSYVYTKSDLTNILRDKNRPNSGIVDVYVSQYSAAGNVMELTFVDASGQKYTYSKESARSILNSSSRSLYVWSQRFTVSPKVALSVIDGSGNTSAVSSIGSIYAIGTERLLSLLPGAASVRFLSSGGKTAGLTVGDTFVVEGRGFGHNVGMSQEGAKGMAERGYTFDQILKYYYTGVDVQLMSDIW